MCARRTGGSPTPGYYLVINRSVPIASPGQDTLTPCENPQQGWKSGNTPELQYSS